MDDMAQLAHTVTDEIKAKIRALVAFGHTQEQVAKYLGISVDTLDKYYRHELDTAKVDAVLLVANRLFRKAVDEGDSTCLIFFLKTQGGWKEPKNPDDQKSVTEMFIEFIKSQNEKKV